MMPVSHPVVHPAPAPAPPAPAPAEAAAAAAAAAQGQGQGGPNAPPRVVMGPDPRARLVARLAQAFLAAAALAPMASARDFASVTAFRSFMSLTPGPDGVGPAFLRRISDLVKTTSYQQQPCNVCGHSLWPFCISMHFSWDVPTDLPELSPYSASGTWITGSLIFSAACASAGITLFINNDLEACFQNHCSSFMAATAMAFLSWFAVAPCCVMSLGSVVHKLQRW